MTVQFAPGTTIDEAAERAIKIQRATNLSFYLLFNGRKMLVDRPDTKENVVDKYLKRVEE